MLIAYDSPMTHRVLIGRRAPGQFGCKITPPADPAAAAHFAHVSRDAVWWLGGGPRVALFEWGRVASYRTL